MHAKITTFKLCKRRFSTSYCSLVLLVLSKSILKLNNKLHQKKLICVITSRKDPSSSKPSCPNYVGVQQHDFCFPILIYPKPMCQNKSKDSLTRLLTKKVKFVNLSIHLPNLAWLISIFQHRGYTGKYHRGTLQFIDV